MLNKQKYKRLDTLLKAYSNENVLKRGYTLIIQDNNVITKKKLLKNKEFTVKFADGQLNAVERK